MSRRLYITNTVETMDSMDSMDSNDPSLTLKSSPVVD